MVLRVRSWISLHPAPAAILGIAGVAALLLAFLGVAQATDKPVFCTSCHEMGPYYEAWHDGPHAGVTCVECHVDAGLSNRVGHKFVALKEVWVHVTSDPLFPKASDGLVPNYRCETCHADVKDAQYPGFSHADHAAKGPCTGCHSDVGHKVTAGALAAAGVLDAAALQAANTRRIATVGEGKANLPAHVKTTCQTCHDMKATGCQSCHTPKHDPRPASCESCHAPGTKWVFSHPRRTDCQTCHTAPARHRTGVCNTCHKNPGVDWKYVHPTGSIQCADCHARPAKHRSGACESCHRNPGVNWSYRHPAAGSNCAGCHARPAGHSAQACANCHKNAGRNWAFSHPGASATCTNCHARPAGHSAQNCTNCHAVATTWAFSHPGASATCTACHARPAVHNTAVCTTCHGVGTSWAFVHPSSTACASCHNPPANHYGTSCASCHTPTKAWSSATFNHPSIPGGEHTYRSFACVNCHPGGYSSYSCTSCHGASGPGD